MNARRELSILVGLAGFLAVDGVLAAPLPSPPAAEPTAPAPAEPSAPAPAPEPEALPVAGWKNGFFVQSPDGRFKLGLWAKVQARFTYEGLDGADDEVAFSVPRLQTGFKGHLFSKDLGYKLGVEFGKGAVNLNDAFVDYRFVRNWFHFRAGQFKKPFSRQQIASSAKLQLVDRAVTNTAFSTGRDIGLMVHNSFEKSPAFEYALGLFNGLGTKGIFDEDDLKFSNVPDRLDPVLVLRLGFNHGGGDGYSETDFQGGAPRFGLAASGQLRGDADNDNDGAVLGEVDYYVKFYGFSTSGGFYWAFDESQDTRKIADQELSTLGLHAQAGYLIAGMVQPSVRYARLFPTGADNDEHELLGGLSVHPYEDTFKATVDAGAILAEQEGADTTTDFLMRAQVQLSF